MMTEEQAFLAAIVAAPDDDGLRLAYADEIEASDPARAEFVRVQCKLAAPWSEKTGECWQCRCARDGGQHTNGPCRCTPEWKALRRRERGLLEEQGLKWAPSMPGHASVEHNPATGAVWVRLTDRDPQRHGSAAIVGEMVFCRGFVDELHCTAARWLAHADALTAAAPILKVTLTTWPAAERVGTSRGYTLYGRPRMGRFRLPGRHREMTSAMTAQEVGQTLLRAEWPRITFTLPDVQGPRGLPGLSGSSDVSFTADDFGRGVHLSNPRILTWPADEEPPTR